jgi:hypothetical protein
MATPPFRDDRDKPDWTMHSPAEIGATGRVRTTDPERCGTIHVIKHTSVVRKRKKNLKYATLRRFAENLNVASTKWTFVILPVQAMELPGLRLVRSSETTTR